MTSTPTSPRTGAEAEQRVRPTPLADRALAPDLARGMMLLLIAQSAVLSHGTVSELISEESWERELRAALDGLLRP